MRSEMKNAVWDADELSTIMNVDRLLPCQPYFSKMYKGGDFFSDLQKTLLNIAPAEKNWDIKTKEGVTYSVLGSDLNTLWFYSFLIHMNGYKEILELGTYLGLSAMYMADAGAHVTTIEKGNEFYDIACENIKRNGFKEKVECVLNDAVDFLREDEKLYDLIFIDAAKESYDILLALSLLRLNKGGLILIDDVFFQGDTLNATPTSEKGAGVRAMLDDVAVLEGYHKVILPIGNGLLMIRKK